MKSNDAKAAFTILFILVLLITVIFGVIYIGRNFNGAESETGENTKPYVAIITKSTESAFWKSVYAGANAAGSEYNLLISFDGPENEEDYETQNELIRKAVEEEADVIIFSAVDYYANGDAINEAADRGVKIIVIDSEVNSPYVSSVISTDNYQAGKMAGEAALASTAETLYVGIVNYDKNSANGQQREKGFLDRITLDKRVVIAETINVLSSIEDSRDGTVALLERHPEINVIATFNEWTSLGVGYAIRDLELANEIHVVAFDSNVVSVGMLETRDVDALIVQSPYAMGYLGMEHAYNLINNLPVKNTSIETKTTLVTRDNMYEDESQKVLFSFD